MNRRGFLKGIGVIIGAAVAAPEIFVPKLIEAPRWKGSLYRFESYHHFLKESLARDLAYRIDFEVINGHRPDLQELSEYKQTYPRLFEKIHWQSATRAMAGFILETGSPGTLILP